MTTSIDGLAVPPWDIADRLRKSLREADIGVQEMADHLGVSRNTVSAWINGRGPVNPECLQPWADLTGFPLKWIEDGDGPGRTPPRPPGVIQRRHPKERVHLRAVVDSSDERADELVTVEDRWSWYAEALSEDTPGKPDDPDQKPVDELVAA